MAYLRPAGLIPDSFTPFRQDYSFDEDRLRSHLRWLSEFPEVQMISIFGGGGEGETVTFEEFKRGVEIAVDVCEPRVKIIPNVHAESYEKAVQKIEAARNAGVSAVRIIHPYYATYTAANLYDYYCEIARSYSDLAIIVYPQHDITARPFPVEILARLADVENIVGIKLSGYTFWDLFRLDMLAKGKDCLLIPGSLQYFYHFCRMGLQSEVAIDSFVPEIAPDLCQSYFRDCKAGRWDEALAGLRALVAVRTAVMATAGLANFPARPKYAMELLGRPVGPARRPKSMPTAEEGAKMRSALTELGLLKTPELVSAGV